jgi:hypothetical protein
MHDYEIKKLIQIKDSLLHIDKIEQVENQL